jgi:hypothetical protein
MLKSISSSAIHEMRVYPRIILPDRRPIVFSPPDPLIEEFLVALKDMKFYLGGNRGSSSADHTWLVEIYDGNENIVRINCHVPRGIENRIHGRLGQFDTQGGGQYYGDFQSEGLFQWYQQYSHRWLGEQHQDENTSIEMTK